jgi:hypothetical protein
VLQELASCFSRIYSQYEGFVGKVHLSTLTKWLGYQDIALIIRELMLVTRSMVSAQAAGYIIIIELWIEGEEIAILCAAADVWLCYSC